MRRHQPGAYNWKYSSKSVPQLIKGIIDLKPSLTQLDLTLASSQLISWLKGHISWGGLLTFSVGFIITNLSIAVFLYYPHQQDSSQSKVCHPNFRSSARNSSMLLSTFSRLPGLYNINTINLLRCPNQQSWWANKSTRGRSKNLKSKTTQVQTPGFLLAFLHHRPHKTC